ncbi:FAD-linked oxidoreductase [Rhodococcus sp. Leaf7]|uniref:D-arabinono-1,4-lactone oxidase n=1 Tax=unclassified Rhodococcus (in: high G+C Gram-positive bacteria) TaxID=192944 RepID=UPI0006F35733|nr:MULTISPECIES: D-arabinono-1,4-lactone oxidase [unclassified Rhodococcus (in: high G+C Gram-positive bacteria)]KQU04002.1 FAD-linked oxidoreductase [Rhodococcus sp. Leaf7]KQU40186.1 FAD-linked oxidoreductase [Rhodococcus sp. Leaf247]
MTAWTNWAGNQHAEPSAVVRPHNADEICRIVAAAPGRVKAVGAGHSFTGAAVTDGILISLDDITGIERVEPGPDGTTDVTVRAGTRLHDLNNQLYARGLALTNMGDIDVQSVAGAISTGTHGTGAAFGGLSSRVVGVRLVGADAREIDLTDGPLFECARLGLGAFGILTAVTMRCVPAFVLHADEKPGRLGDALERFPDDMRTVDHPEFYWFPHTDRVLTKRNTRMPADTPLDPVGRLSGAVDDALSNNVFEALNRVSTRVPSVIPRMNRLSAAAWSGRTATDRSDRIFASSRRVRFREMEYAVPPESLPHVIREIDAWIERTQYRVSFPVEVRCAAADDVWLSTAYRRDSVYVAVHQYHRRPDGGYFDAVEAIARDVGGRPHWGKLHSLDGDTLRTLYPRFDDVVAERDRVDPHRVFDNDYSDRVLTRLE